MRLGQRIILILRKCNSTQTRNHHRPAKKVKPECDCLKANKPRKRSIWNLLRSKKDTECVKQDVKAGETITEPASEAQIACDIEQISELGGGKVYRTCGSAYVLQKSHIPLPNVQTAPEENILEEMTKHPSLKGQVDPMPPYETAEKRLIDLCERKLHPLYKRLMSIPKQPKPTPPQLPKAIYKTRSGPISPADVPEKLKLNKEMFERKNIFHEFKKAQPPQQLMARMVEMKQNQRATLEKKIDQKNANDNKHSKSFAS
ncbi:hypothetical protein GWI33_004870 [Rhynchophorus ferrugineus]|uniref:Uncharacterized protein n=1 Tax=Rhynchophorus ferrugineus TaxID=354439 RepID=A0A834MK44_RHYFE|nr:hypothetical protein GWI33_004870 [Rhynchophorus ferrugineus]